MPKIIPFKKEIYNAYNNRDKLNVSVETLAKIFNVDRKTIYNISRMKLDDLNSNNIKRKKYIDTISDEIKNFHFIVNETINNAYFKVLNLQKDIKKKYKIDIDKRYIYQILKEKNITYKKAVIKEKPKKIIDVDVYNKYGY